MSKDIDVVIRDAFKAVRRRLQDYARRQRGQVKVLQCNTSFAEG